MAKRPATQASTAPSTPGSRAHKTSAKPRTVTSKASDRDQEKKAREHLENIKKKDAAQRLKSAYLFREKKYWEVLGHETLEDAVSKKTGITYRNFLRYANAAKAYHQVTGRKDPDVCKESALRALTSLSKDELQQFKEYLESSETDLKDKTKSQIEKLIFKALAPDQNPNGKAYKKLLDQLSIAVAENLGEAEVTSPTAINIIADRFAKAVATKLRKALMPKKAGPRKSSA